MGEGANALLHTGSGTFERLNKQRTIERVARDWCLTIRGSQVIPVYPLDEDVVVGDIYIVDTPIDRLKSYWNKRGYLPIDHRFGRIQPKGFAAYYPGGSYGIQKESVLPKLWQSPEKTPSQKIPAKPGENPPATGVTAAAADDAFLLTDWPKAPRAGFPSYSFRIRAGESFNGALPVQGVPVMLGALGARDVSGSVTLTDAFTYGIDEPSLRDNLYNWAQVNKGYLSTYALPPDGDPKKRNYIRVITRVYLVRSVNISMTNLEASDWKVSVGAPKGPASDNTVFDQGKPEDKLLKSLNDNLASHSLVSEAVTVPAAPAPATPPTIPDPVDPGIVLPQSDEDRIAAEKRKLALHEEELGLAEKRQQLAQRRQALGDAVKQQKFNAQAFALALQRATSKDAFGGYVLPGGTLQMMSATNKSISMKETFTRPLVVGYHALEFAILDNGELSGRPVSTYNRLELNQNPSFEAIQYEHSDSTSALRRWLSQSKDHREQLRHWLAQQRITADVPTFLDEPRYTEARQSFAATINLKN